MRHPLAILGRTTVPQAPGHRAGWRASGTTQQRRVGIPAPRTHLPRCCLARLRRGQSEVLAARLRRDAPRGRR